MSLNLGREDWGFPAFMLLCLAILIHVVDIAVRLKGESFGVLHPIIFLYILIALFASIIFKGETLTILDKRIGSNTAAHRFVKYLIVSLIAYCIPFVNYLFEYFPAMTSAPFLGASIKIFASAIILFAPVWVIYIMYLEPTKITAIVGALYLVFWVVVILLTHWQPISAQVQQAEIPGVMPGMTVGFMLGKMYTGIEYVMAGIPRTKEYVSEQISIQMEISKTGIDPRQEIRTKAGPDAPQMTVQKVSDKYYTNSPIALYATLKATPFEETLPLQMTVGCKATSDIEYGTIFPQNTFTIETENILDVDCLFQPEQLDKGVHTITFTSNFNYGALAYIETVFMTEEKLTETKKKKQDPLATYPALAGENSKGPVSLNINLPTAPIATKENKEFSIGITLFKMGKGKIKQINDLYIYLPKGLKTVKDRGLSDIYEETTCSELPEEEARVCNPEAVEVYKVKKSELSKQLYQNILTVREFRMYLEIEDYDLLMSQSTEKPGSFHASLKYDYELEQSLDIRVVEPLEAST
ncbi:hypothetical protein JW851_00510 [Candidatus Woesearchaeota archaeon]|nr:hypothetical protein [Candidatus Woesearchaeota archaeon]